MNVWWLHHNALKDANIGAFCKDKSVVLVKVIHQMFLAIWKRLPNGTHMMEWFHEKLSPGIISIHLPPICPGIKIWNLTILIVGIRCCVWVSRKKYRHSKLELHGIRLDILRMQLYVWNS